MSILKLVFGVVLLNLLASSTGPHNRLNHQPANYEEIQLLSRCGNHYWRKTPGRFNGLNSPENTEPKRKSRKSSEPRPIIFRFHVNLQGCILGGSSQDLDMWLISPMVIFGTSPKDRVVGLLPNSRTPWLFSMGLYPTLKRGSRFVTYTFSETIRSATDGFSGASNILVIHQGLAASFFGPNLQPCQTSSCFTPWCL